MLALMIFFYNAMRNKKNAYVELSGVARGDASVENMDDIARKGTHPYISLNLAAPFGTGNLHYSSTPHNRTVESDAVLKGQWMLEEWKGVFLLRDIESVDRPNDTAGVAFHNPNTKHCGPLRPCLCQRDKAQLESRPLCA